MQPRRNPSRRRQALAVALLLAALVAAAPRALAVDDSTVGHVSFGLNFPTGDANDFLDTGWAIHGGVSFFPSAKPIGLRLDFGLDWWDVSDDVLETIDTDPTTPIAVEPPDNGYARAWSLSADFIYDPHTKGTVGYYLVAGASGYYTQLELTEDGYVAGYWCDWWWGICYPGVTSGQYLIKSNDSWEWGLNAGAGITFELDSGSELYIETIYHWVQTEQVAELIPVTFGIRW